MVVLMALMLASAAGAGAPSPYFSGQVEIAPEVRMGDVRPTMLLFENVEVPSNRAMIVRVFADLPEGAVDTTPKSRYYLGYFAVVPENKAESPEPRKLTTTVHVRNKRLPSTEPFRVTLIPVDRTGVPLTGVNIAVGRIVLTGDRPP